MDPGNFVHSRVRVLYDDGVWYEVCSPLSAWHETVQLSEAELTHRGYLTCPVDAESGLHSRAGLIRLLEPYGWAPLSA